MTNYSVATWNTSDLFSGDPKAFVDFHVSIGAEAICIKIGNGLHPWVGLEPFIAEAKARGLKVAAWWYFYGNKGEAQIAADHAEKLGCDVLILDIEGHWKSRAPLTESGRIAKAEGMMKVLTSRFSGEIDLCSIWKPSIHRRIPVEVFLKNGCTYNMPMWYWIGRRSNELVVDLIEQSLEEYGRLANWSPSKTIPVLASYGQSYTVRLKKYWWKTTIAQMQTAYDLSIARGCPGVNWWSLDYLMGRAGHEAPKVVEHGMIEKIRSFSSIPSPSIPNQLKEMAKQLVIIADKLDRGG